MIAPSIKEALELKPCPFCGGDAESDCQRHYRNISTGNLEKSAAIYCTKCSADMTWCYRDTPEIEREQVMLLLTEQWNTRATLSQPTADRREIVARLIREHVEYGYDRADDQQQSIIGIDEAADAILAALDGGLAHHPSLAALAQFEEKS